MGTKLFVLWPWIQWYQIWQTLTWSNLWPQSGREPKVWKIVLGPKKFWPLASKRLTWGQIWEVFQIERYFFRIEAIYLSLGAKPAKAMPCTFNQKFRKFCIDDVSWPGKCWSKVTKFAPARVLVRAFPSLKFGVSSSSGSRDSRGLYNLYAPLLQGV